MARIKRVSDICEMDSRILGCSTPKECSYCGMDLKLSRKEPPKVLVIWSAAPNSMENRKKMAIFFCLKSTSASSPKAESRVFFWLFVGGHAGRVKAYIPNSRAAAAPT